jgi:hypothetical protein
MVRGIKSSHLKLDKLGTIILPRAKGDWEDPRAKRVRRITWDDPVEGRLAGHQHILEIQAHLFQSTDEYEIEPASAIDEDLGELDLRHHGIENQWELTGLRKARPLIVARE